MTLSLDVYGSNITRHVSFKNQLADTTSGKNYEVLKSGTITYNAVDAFLGDSPTIFNSGVATEGVIHAYRTTTGTKISTSSLGKIDYVNGIISINPGILPTSTKTTLTVKTKNQDKLQFNGELLLKVNTLVNGV
jgi:hypothetical protein